jgi:PA domain
MSNKFATTAAAACAAAFALLATASQAAQFNITFVNNPGEGFNDPTPTAPIGGNPGTTLGEQRQYAFLKAADIWGAALQSVPTIAIQASFSPLPCSELSATLGSAGPRSASWNFPEAPYRDTFYVGALANKLTGADLYDGAPVIGANFNSNLGKPGCLSSRPFYLGLDSKGSAQTIDLVVVALHEFGHGLGFLSLTDAETGEQPLNQPTAFDQFIYDTGTNKYRSEMTDTERVASALNTKRVVWDGDHVTSAARQTLTAGLPNLQVFGPFTRLDPILVTPAQFGPQSLGFFGEFGQIVPVKDVAGSTQACAALDSATVGKLRGNIALIDRGNCNLSEKVKRVQDAGASAAIIVENTPIRPAEAARLFADDPVATQIRIPTASIIKSDGDTIRNGTTQGFPVFGRYSENRFAYRGTDLNGQVLIYTPFPYSGGSTMSHFDTSASRNLLMEPAFSFGLTQSVKAPIDLTFALFRDIGW